MKTYLGDAAAVHTFVGEFADLVMASYHRFLSKQAMAAEVQAEIDALTTKFGDALMGRDDRYRIAPWQGQRLAGKFLAALPQMKGTDEPGKALFEHLALNCVKASLALRDNGRPADEVGMELKEILDDARGRILGTVI